MTTNSATERVGRMGILWRGDPHAENPPTAVNNRMRRIFEALAELKVEAEPVVYSDDVVEEVRKRLLVLDGVLVWVNPIENGADRSKLDAMLREVSAEGVWVSAHPDVILKMGTKEVLFQTRELGWGTDTYLYRTVEEFRAEFPPRLAAGGARVLKQYRGNGGNGVWKVELLRSEHASPGDADEVRVQHAQRGSGEETLRLGEFIMRCEEYFAGSGRLVDQPFLPRLEEGMVRCYVVLDEVVGFSPQTPRDLLPLPPVDEDNTAAPPRWPTMEGPSAPVFQTLKANMESKWLPAMKRLVDVDTDSLPVIWDADFLYGPKTDSGEDTYVLCEINISAVFPFPDEAVEKVAQAAVDQMLSAKGSRV